MDASPQPKLGLALSGGGFRAAFFHLGVLARLAELGPPAQGRGDLDRLRRLDRRRRVLPAAEVAAAVAARTPRSPTPMYCDLVADVADRLRAMVRQNVRGRIFLNPFKNLAMASRRYSRSDRIGDLYDLYLYNPAWEGERPKTRWARRHADRAARAADPAAGRGEGFKPDEDNHRLSAKVPILLLNATTLNSGHHWRFEAVRMGEPLPDDPEMRRVVEDADKNIRLEQGYFEPREGKPPGDRAPARLPARARGRGVGLRARPLSPAGDLRASTTGSRCSSSTAGSRTTRASRACSTRAAPT